MNLVKIGLLGCALFLTGCQAMVYTQTVPISTNPMGADIYVDGVAKGTTPASLELGRDQDHIITLTKPGYQQEDVTVKRVYHAETTILNAVSKGVNDADFFGNSSMGFQSGVASLSSQQATGEAYSLSPSAVTVRLLPSGGLSSSALPVVSGVQGGAAIASNTVAPSSSAPIDILGVMNSFDHEMLDRALETGRSGQPVQWTNPQTGWNFMVTPEPAQMQHGKNVRTFKAIASKNGKSSGGHFPAYRENRNDWRIGYPMETAGQPAVAPVNERALLFGAASAAASTLKPLEADKKLSESSSSHESWGNDGSYTKTTESSSTHVGASIDPAGVINLLEDLTRPASD